jgi:hypothetical protein
MHVLRVVCYTLYNKVLPDIHVDSYLVFSRVSCIDSFIFVMVEFVSEIIW